jgi:hypothetical protein
MLPNRKHVPGVEAEVIRLYRENLSRDEIARRAKVGKTTICAILKRNNEPLRLPRNPAMEARDAEVVRLYLANVERRHIVQQTGVPNSTITHILKRNGVERNHVRRPSLPEERVEAVRQLFLEGKSYTQIAQALGITNGSVAGLVHRKGWSRSETIARANIRLAASARSPRKTNPGPRLVAVASADDTRVFLVPEADAPKFARPEPASVLTADDDPVVKLRALDCRWPIGEAGKIGFRFCCAVKIGVGPYCSEHQREAYRPASKSEKDSISIGRWA